MLLTYFSIFIATRLQEWKITMWLRVVNAALPDTAHVIPMLQHWTLDRTADLYMQKHCDLKRCRGDGRPALRAAPLVLKGLVFSARTEMWLKSLTEAKRRRIFQIKRLYLRCSTVWFDCRRVEETPRPNIASHTSSDRYTAHQSASALCHTEREIRWKITRWDVNWVACESGTIQWATVHLGFTPSWWCNDAVVSSAAHPRHTLHFFLRLKKNKPFSLMSL